MPVPTPFHPRTSALCATYKWKDWGDFHSVSAYSISPEREYNAVRQGAGLIDVTPLYKYDVGGPEAGGFLAHLTVRDLKRLPVGRVVYLCWCDDAGRVIDDGTCSRLAPRHYRLTANEPAFHWLSRQAAPFDVTLEDTTHRLGALAVQGPMAREVLRTVTDADLDALRFFGTVSAQLDGIDVVLTRTGYTGDLGYEVWVEADMALSVWDALMANGKDYGLAPVGLSAMDVCRIEAGFILHGVDYFGAFHAVTDAQMSTPFELGLGWTVKLGKDGRRRFVGSQALAAEKARGSRWALVGLDIDWEALERLYDEYGLPPALPAAAWRSPVPVYKRGRMVGHATSGAWSPILKKNLALATVEADVAQVSSRLEVEWTAEWARRTLPATVVETPFFDPERKRAGAARD